MYKSYCSSTRNTRNQDNITPPKSVNPTVVASSESLLHETPRTEKDDYNCFWRHKQRKSKKKKKIRGLKEKFKKEILKKKTEENQSEMLQYKNLVSQIKNSAASLSYWINQGE